MSYNARNYTEQGGDVTRIGGTLIIEDGATVTGLSGGSEYSLPVATASVLGGVKVGSGLSITEEGVLSADGVTPAANQTDSEATTVEALLTDFNALLTKLKDAGLMVDDD